MWSTPSTPPVGRDECEDKSEDKADMDTAFWTELVSMAEHCNGAAVRHGSMWRDLSCHWLQFGAVLAHTALYLLLV